MDLAKHSRILVIGGGSWATALIKILSQNQSPLSWWMRDQSAIAHLKEHSHNPKYLQSATFDTQRIEISGDLRQLVTSAKIIIIAVPSAFVHETLQHIPTELFRNKIVFSALKGMIPDNEGNSCKIPA